MTEKRLRFVLKVTDRSSLHNRFFPNGEYVLNRTEWRGNPPRSCAVTGLHSDSFSMDEEGPIAYDLEVTVRPDGCITYVANTKYDGWRAMALDKGPDGTLLDGNGRPLPDGQPPVYLPFEMYKDVEFNDLDFGEFVGESEVPAVPHTTFDAVLKAMKASGKITASIDSSFVASRRSRPHTKVMFSNMPSFKTTQGGMTAINISNSTAQKEHVLMEQLAELMSGFIEGRLSLTCFSNDDVVFVELSDSVIDCTLNEEGLDTWFDMLGSYVPLDFLEHLAKRLMSLYRVDVTVVDGPKPGLLLKHIKPEKKS